ncbi:MAG: DDE-type integrase/transposase/recombinase [Bacillota bacterium]|nr:DDE-type integrase/transposase/recombinase [Bacillota bacterium]
MLKEELPTRSDLKIIIMLELARKTEKGFLKLRTVNRLLKHYGYTLENLTKNNRVYFKHEKISINKIWQSDIMEACYIKDSDGNGRMVYLIGFIYDHSRRILHCQFYFESTLTRLEDCLQKAVIKFGAPDSIYVDNDKVYISEQFKIICAKLGITLKYATAYHAAIKGKIQVFCKFVQSSFLPEVRKNKVSNIIQLNDLFQAWLKYECHEKLHSSINMTSIERWKKSISDGTKLRYFSSIQLDEIFMHCCERTVTKYGVISFEGNTYEVDGALVGKKIEVHYNPFHL